MDEPLSNLDAKLRVQMRADIKKLQSDLGVTTIYVTHDQVEAMTMGDRVAVMRKGELQQVAPPQELYDRPANIFVGGLHRQPRDEHARGAGRARRRRRRHRARRHRGSSSTRPSRLRLRRTRAANRPRHPPRESRGRRARRTATAGGRLRGRAELREALGSEVLVHFTIAARQAVTEDVRELAEDVGDDRAVEQLAGEPPAGGDARRPVQPADACREAGESIDVWVDLQALHFFDPDTGPRSTEPDQAGTGASSRRSPSAFSSLHRSAGIGSRSSAAFRSICSGERAPTHTLSTAG